MSEGLRVSVGVEAAWGLASQEAISVRFAEIEPEHFLESLLKFSEMPTVGVAKMAPDPMVAAYLNVEAQEVREELSRRAIDSKRIRRELREALGDGRTPHCGDVIHRSARSRDVFDAAARIAADAGSDVLMCKHLLEAILKSPTPVTMMVLGMVHGETGAQGTCMHAEGKPADLDRAKGIGPAVTPEGCSPECTVLLRTLGQAGRKNILLIAEDVSAAGRTVMEAASLIGSRQVDKALWGKVIVDARVGGQGQEQPDALRDRLQRLFADVASDPNVIVLMPEIEVNGSGGGEDGRAELAKQLLKVSGVRCICPMTPEAHRTLVGADRAWKRLGQPIWLQKAKEAEVPWEL